MNETSLAGAPLDVATLVGCGVPTGWGTSPGERQPWRGRAPEAAHDAAYIGAVAVVEGEAAARQAGR